MEITLRGDDIASIFDKGLQAHNAGDLIAAEQLYQETLSIQPNHCEANHNIGVVLAAKNKLDEALKFFKYALDSSPNVSLFWASYIDALIKLERIAESKTLIKAVKDAGISCDKIEAISQRLDVEHQEPEPKDTQELNELIELQKFDEAIQACLSLMDTYPSSAVLNINLGKCYLEFEQIEQAKEYLKKAVELQPDDPELYTTLAVELLHKGKHLDAIEYLKEALKLKPNSTSILSVLGDAYNGLDQHQLAISYYKKALSLDPNDERLHFNIGNAYGDAGNLKAAIQSYKQAIKIKPDFAEAYCNMGGALHEKGDIDKAIHSYRETIKIKPNHAEAYNNLGISFVFKKETDAAIASFKSAIQIKPTFFDAHRSLGHMFALKKNMPAAFKSFKKAVQINPKGDVGLNHMVAAFTGQQTTSAPKKYVEDLFDAYAAKFDNSLVNKLEYKAPKLLTSLLLQHQTSGSLGTILDLGCGTGLAGVELRHFCQTIHGIDLSQEMLDEARRKNAYNELNHAGIVDYLSEAPLDFDLFVSTDVFIYLGELSEVFNLIKSRNKRKGRLAFSTEHTEQNGFFLEKTGRYSHSKCYIENLCRQFNYHLLHFSKIKLRKEQNKFLTGGLYLLEF